MNDICLEKVTSRDEAEIVSKLANKIWTEYYTPILGKAQIEYMLQKFSSPDRIMNDINDSGFVYFMVIYNSKLAGYTAIQPDFESKTLFLSKL
ncbi:MAG TPA: GNAT family N-acetyltransferase, partial [Ruminiclostridium sp.]|nr:GNAT family N-acetyltransferase [Ruminiclostridium sp.]